MRTPDEQEHFLSEGRFRPDSDKRRPSRGWLRFLVVLLFPVPFSPWWLSIICLVVFWFAGLFARAT